MATSRKAGDVTLDFRNMDFSTMSEKGLPDPYEQLRPLKLLELFGGIGAPRRALENIFGPSCLRSIDYIEVLPYAVQSYNQIFQCGPRPQDIRIWNLAPDIVVHGSPCQDFSNEGKNNINTGRSILFERTLQILDPTPKNGFPELSRQPKVVIWENVPGLLWKFQDCMEYYQEVMDEFGYYSYHKILTASDYNIPQNRDRVFVVSILKDVPGADRFEFPEKMTPQWTLKDFIDKKVSFNDPAVQLKDAEKAILGTLPDGTLTVREGTKKGYAEVKEWQIINLAIPGSKNRRGRVGDNAKTITTAPRQAIYYHGKVRMLTAKEYLRLMGYRDQDYEKMSKAGITDQQICQLAGNSICVPVLEALFRKLHDMDIIQDPSEVLRKNLEKPKQKKEKEEEPKRKDDQPE